MYIIPEQPISIPSLIAHASFYGLPLVARPQVIVVTLFLFEIFPICGTPASVWFPFLESLREESQQPRRVSRDLLYEFSRCFQDGSNL